MSASSASNARPDRRTLALYAAPAFATALPTIPVYVLLPEHYASATGLSVAAIGLAFMLSRLLDVVTDPAIGWLIDRVATPWGRRRPWIVLGGLVCVPALLFVTAPPEDAGMIYLMGWLGLLYLGWSLFQIPYYALGAELTSDRAGRTRVTAVREAMVLAGILSAAVLPVLFTAAGLPGARHTLAIAVVTLAFGAVSLFALVAFLREGNAPARLSHAGWREFLEAARNRLFLRLYGAWIVNGIANGVASVLFPFYIVYVLDASETAKGLLILAYFASAVITLPVWLRLSERLDKSRTWLLAILLCCAVFVWVPFISQGAILPFAIVCLLTGATLGADLAIPPSLLADVTDWERYRTGRPRTGTFFGLWTMAAKLSLAISAGAALYAVGLFGFEKGPGNPSSALLAVAVVYAVVPVVLKLAVAGLLWTYPFGDRAHEAVRQRLDRRGIATA